jgi:hypothetical protein
MTIWVGAAAVMRESDEIRISRTAPRIECDMIVVDGRKEASKSEQSILSHLAKTSRSRIRLCVVSLLRQVVPLELSFLTQDKFLLYIQSDDTTA